MVKKPLLPVAIGVFSFSSDADVFPLPFRIVGMLFLGLSAMATNHTAKLLARCLERAPNKALVSYSDIAYIAYGQKARVIVSIMFSMELMAACVALVVLFADSLHSLIPSISVLGWKIIAGFALTPSSFLPLRILSFTSILGILSTCSIFLIVLINGLIKSDFPGSLLDPAPTYLFPQSWLTLPLSFGLLMSPWGGHGVFPNIYKDMRLVHIIPALYWNTQTYVVTQTSAQVQPCRELHLLVHLPFGCVHDGGRHFDVWRRGQGRNHRKHSGTGWIS